MREEDKVLLDIAATGNYLPCFKALLSMSLAQMSLHCVLVQWIKVAVAVPTIDVRGGEEPIHYQYMRVAKYNVLYEFAFVGLCVTSKGYSSGKTCYTVLTNGYRQRHHQQHQVVNQEMSMTTEHKATFWLICSQTKVMLVL